LAGRLRVFEVDHPATQRWKRDLLDAARLAPPDGLAFVGMDLETERLGERLAAEGFDPTRPALVSWLGVSMYLTVEAVAATLAAVGGLAAGTELVLEYALPSELRDQAGADYAGFALPVAEERGEPWLSFFTPGQLSGLLEDHGMKVAEQARQQDAVPAALWRRSDALRPLDLRRRYGRRRHPSPPRGPSPAAPPPPGAGPAPAGWGDRGGRRGRPRPAGRWPGSSA